MEITLTLPWPPSVNHYKKIGRMVKTKSGKMYQQRVNSDETKTFYFQVYMLAKKQMPPEWPKSVDGGVITYEVYIELSPPSNHRYDVDNRLKVLLDSFVHAKIILDDSLVHKLTVIKKPIVEGGRTVVMIKEILDAES